MAPPTEVPTTSLIALPLKNSWEVACAVLESKANPNREKNRQKVLLFIEASLSILEVTVRNPQSWKNRKPALGRASPGDGMRPKM